MLVICISHCGAADTTIPESTPVGTIMQVNAFNEIPKDFRLCNGQRLSREKYSELFSVIGEEHGKGDGSTTFNLPNLTEALVDYIRTY